MSGDRGYCDVCSKAAELRCSGCKKVVYCSKEHQKLDWKMHKNQCKAFEVKSSKELGRYVVACRDLEPGETIFTEIPLFFAPKSFPDPESVAPCVGCYRPVSLDMGERCPSCGWPVCAGNCPGLTNLRHHGLECPILTLRAGHATSGLGDYYRHDALLALRCILAQKKFHKKYAKLMEFQSHEEDRGPLTDVYLETQENVVSYLINNYLHPLRAVENELKTNIAPDISEKLLHKICGIIDVNALDLRLPLGSELSALYTFTCIMEHNCMPNTKYTFETINTEESEQYKIKVKAIVPIKKGDHITTMYSHALWGTQARRQHLKISKYFDCVCDRCKDPTEFGTYLNALKCMGDENKTCVGIQLPIDPCSLNPDWKCDTCDVKIKGEEVDYLISKLGEEVDMLQASGPTVSKLENLITKLSTFLHPNHYHMYSLKHSLVQLYGYQQGHLHHQMTEEDLEKKAQMCNELLQITLKLDPGNSRLSLYTAVLYHELFQARNQLMKRQLDTKGHNRSEIGQTAYELKKMLRTAVDLLEDEGTGSPGERLVDVIKESQQSLEQWKKSNFVD